ncbi:phenylacetate--CoA ligase family protein [Sulfuricystis thermophila]|uniref:phenylacetate--CoA ligase family protein n=1 Tax=Sulfuricystis thermophila TaxID=2496847 RepID=UPI001035603B|nr:AMP-binding protein [Sulfuricystis thermophila]
MNEHFDALETRDPEAREHDLMARLPEQIAHAKAHAPWFAESLRDVDPAAITSREALAQLPVLRKHALIELQKRQRPFGGLVASRWGQMGRVFASPGPIYEPEGRRPDYWRTARALFAAGFRAGDLVHNSFSYHMTPGAWIVEGGALALGCTVFPGGVGQTEQQVQAMADLQPHGYVGTPSFLRILLEKADELGLKIPSLTKALVSGEAFLPAVREALSARGIQGFQAYATADLGVIAYETPAREGLVVDEDVIVEIVRPGTGEPVPQGEVGEVVVTTFNIAYPLIRFGTGDLSAVLPGLSPCGRTNMRIRGWLGRADQTVKIKGMFVHPEQIAAVVKRHPGITRARLVVTNPDASDAMTLLCEGAGDVAAIAASLRELTKLRGEVCFVPSGSLPNDGKVISDERKFE